MVLRGQASMKSCKPKPQNGGDGNPPPNSPASGGGRNAEVDVKGRKRSNETHQSTTDPQARLYLVGRGMEAKLCFIRYALMENRNGLIVDARLTLADGQGERYAALSMIEPLGRPDVRDRPGRRQGLRRRGFRQQAEVAERAAARGPERQRPALGDRPANHPPRRIRDSSPVAGRLLQQPARPIDDAGNQLHWQ